MRLNRLVSVEVASCSAGAAPGVWDLRFNCQAAFSLTEPRGSLYRVSINILQLFSGCSFFIAAHLIPPGDADPAGVS